MARQPVRLRRGIAWVSGVMLLMSGLAAAPVLAAPTQDDIDRVLAEAESTQAAIVQLEVLLTSNNAAADEAALEASIATEAFLVAEEELEAARAEEAKAAEEKAKADEELQAAAHDLAAIAIASYRNGGELNELEVFFTSNGVENALRANSYLQRRGQQTDGLLQRHEAAEIIADLATTRAAEATADRQVAAEDLQTKADSAQARSDEAAAAVAETDAQRARLLTQLADLRNTSVEMEAERQAEQERQRIARENTVARNNVVDRSTAEAEAPAGNSTADEPAATAPSTSAAPTTQSPAAPSANPTTQEPTTSAPTTQAPTTQAPTTQAPTTPAPRPTTSAPAPTTQAPTTQAPTTPAPTTPPPPKPKPTTPPPPPPAPAPSGKGAAALAWAKTQLGKPYVYGAAGPNSYDCSGLTLRAFQQAGVNLPRTSGAQYNVGSKVSVNNMQPGDLFFYSNNGQPSGIYHVAIYAGNGMRLHAPSPGKSVELVPMWWANVLPLAVRL